MSGTNRSPMDGLVTLARVGTERHKSAAEMITNTPIDHLTPTQPTEELERAILLRAGAMAIYRQAGRTSPEAVEAPPLAPPETRPACSPGAATLIGRMLKEENVLLPEALKRLDQAGQRLPFDLLPSAFNGQSEDFRRLLAPVMGERGRWLSHFVDSWDWVDATLIELAGGLPPNADDLWQEGKLEQRLALLRQARQFAPERARAWVAAVWKQEKVETREKLIECYEINLSPDDEPFLEAALDDRGKDVRAVARRLLTSLPGSAFANRALERADAMLDVVAGKVVARPPKEAQKEWERDGFAIIKDTAPQKNKGVRALLLTEALALVNPMHWQERFGLTPEELIGALGEKNDWEEAIRDSWTRAALAHGATAWMLPLWRWRHAIEANTKRYYHSDYYTARLLASATEEDRRRLAAEMIAHDPIKANDSQHARQWSEVINAAPAPWDDEFSLAYLAGLRVFAGQVSAELLSDNKTPALPWIDTLAYAPTALAGAHLALATQPLKPPPIPDDKRSWQLTNIHQLLGDFTNLMLLRQRLFEEIPAGD